MKDFSQIWVEMLVDIMANGNPVAPRGIPTKELPQKTIEVDTRRPVLMIKERGLNYQFMAAETYWILSGDDRVKTIEPFNKNIAKYSDNGTTFFGAYGPKIIGQLDYVVDKLYKDVDSRQAGLTIWRENPPITKDVPCTIAIFFNIRENHLNCHVFMRSSDVWLGVPYDVFTFSMLTHLVCAKLNELDSLNKIFPGRLFLTAASSHLYESNWAAVKEIIKENLLMEITWSNNRITQPQTPSPLFVNSIMLMAMLQNLRVSVPGDNVRWWEK